MTKLWFCGDCEYYHADKGEHGSCMAGRKPVRCGNCRYYHAGEGEHGYCMFPTPEGFMTPLSWVAPEVSSLMMNCPCWALRRDA